MIVDFQAVESCLRSGLGKSHLFNKTRFPGNSAEFIFGDLSSCYLSPAHPGANSWPDASAEKEEIADVIRTVAQGRNYLPAKLGGKLANFAFRAELTERELDVLRSMCEGKSNEEIGAKLFVTEGTVKTHVKSIFYKLDVFSRSEAVSTAIRRGLVGDDDR